MVTAAPSAATDRPTHVLEGPLLRHMQAEPSEIQTLTSTSDKQTREGLVGDLWIRKNWALRADISGLAVPVEPSEAGRTDALHIICDDSAPPQGFAANLANANKLHGESLLMSMVSERYELYRPGLFKPASMRDPSVPPPGAVYMSTATNGIQLTRILDFNSQTQVVRFSAEGPPSSALPTLEAPLLAILRAIRLPHTIPHARDGSLRALAAPPPTITFGPPPAAPHPPAGAPPPGMQPPNPNLFQSQPPPAPVIDMSGDACVILRTVVQGLEGFPPNVDWANAPFFPLAKAISILSTPIAITAQQAGAMSESARTEYLGRAAQIFHQKFQQAFVEGIVDRARLATTDAESRKRSLTAYDNFPTPPRADCRPSARDGPPPAAPRRSNVAQRPHAAGAPPPGAEALAGDTVDLARNDSEQPSRRHRGQAAGEDDDSSDEEEDEDAADRDVHHRRQRRKHTDQEANKRSNYSALALICPPNMLLDEVATELTKAISGEYDSAVAAFRAALKAANIPPRIVIGSNPLDIANAAIAVAIEHVYTSRGKTIDPPPSRACLSSFINNLLAGLQQIAQSNTTSGPPNPRAGGYRFTEGALRPNDDTERAFANSCIVAPSAVSHVAENISQYTPWMQAAEASPGAITPETPVNVLRLQMTDKFAIQQQGESLPQKFNEYVLADYRTRAKLAVAAAERVLGGALSAYVKKHLELAIPCLDLTKLPPLSKLAESTESINAFGVAVKMESASTCQAVSAIRAACMAMWPEVDWSLLVRCEDDIRAMMEGKREVGISADMPKARAAQLWTSVAKHITARATDFRDTKPPFGLDARLPVIRDFLDSKTLTPTIDAALEANKAATSLIAAMALASASRTSTSSDAKKPLLKDLTTPWVTKFGKEACIFWWCNGTCNPKDGKQCSRKHQDANLNKSEVTSWMTANNVARQVDALSRDLALAAEAEPAMMLDAPPPLAPLDLPEAMSVQAQADPLPDPTDAAAEQATPADGQLLGLAEGIGGASLTDPAIGPEATAPAVETRAAREARFMAAPATARFDSALFKAASDAYSAPPRGEGDDARDEEGLPPPQQPADVHHEPSARDLMVAIYEDERPASQGAALAIPTNSPLGQLEGRDTVADPTANYTIPDKETMPERHARVVNNLMRRPEGEAIARALASGRVENANLDPLRKTPADDDVVRRLPLRHVWDRSIPRKAGPLPPDAWRLAVEAKGGDPEWRPPGDATTLCLPGKESAIYALQRWHVKASISMCEIYDGKQPSDVPAELRIVSAEVMKPEALLLLPWWIEGDYYYNPIPMAVYFAIRPRRVPVNGCNDTHEADVSYFDARAEAGDPDEDICRQVSEYAVSNESEIIDTLCKFHLTSFYEDPKVAEIATNTIEKEVDQGIFRGYMGVPCFPVRHMPRFTTDEGLREDGTPKLRLLVHNSYPHAIDGVWRYPEGSQNSRINLNSLQPVTLGSGKKHFSSVGVLASSVTPQSTHCVEDSKRDGSNAFRAFDTSPLEWWMKWLVAPCKRTWLTLRVRTDRSCLDGGIQMGDASAVARFASIMDVPARHISDMCWAFDLMHPPTEKAVIEFQQLRLCDPTLTNLEAQRLDTDDQYLDDHLRAGLTDKVVLREDVHGASPHGNIKILKGGSTVSREYAKITIMDGIFHLQLKMKMAPPGSSKCVTTRDWMEALGVEGSPKERVMRYPARKVPSLINAIESLIAKGWEEDIRIAVRRDEVHSLISKETWLAQVALEVNALLASGWAIFKSPGGSPRVMLNETFEKDQKEIISILKTGTDVPMNPKSSWPAITDPASAPTFQDASGRRGAGGWGIAEGELHCVRYVWPQAVAESLAVGDWSISPAEAWILKVCVAMMSHATPRRPLYITNFTDNESARAAANKGTSNSRAMNLIATATARLTTARRLSLRTMRVTTHENRTADDLSRMPSAPPTLHPPIPDDIVILANAIELPLAHVHVHEVDEASLALLPTDMDPEPPPSSPSDD